MRRPAAAASPWRDSLGIVLTVLGAVLLAIVLWQLTALGGEAGLDRATLRREQIGMDVTDQTLAVQDAFVRYRYALVMEAPDLGAKRAAADGAMQALSKSVDYGPASRLDLSGKVKKIRELWQKARVAKPGRGGIHAMSPVMSAIGNFYSSLQDASNLSYDTSITGQNIAASFVGETPFAISTPERLRLMVESLMKYGDVTLKRRLDLSNQTSGVRAAGDFSGDNWPQVTKRLEQMLPAQRAQWEKLLPLSNATNAADIRLADYVSKNVLLKPQPNVDLAQLRALTTASVSAARAMHAAEGQALRASLAARGKVQQQRNRYFYLAFVVGAMLLVGVMVMIAQAVARRDRLALRRAQQESAALQAELARQEAEEALRLSEAQFRAVFDGAAVGIAVVNRGGTIVEANNVYRTMFGDNIERAISGHEVELAELLAGKRDTFEFEQSARSPSGQEIFTDATISIVNDDGDMPLFGICMFRDKTALKHSERRMMHDKLHDSLTGLPNRQLFEQALRDRFDEATALLESFFAVLFVDLEHFRDVNESMGHSAGDVVLTQIAGRLRSSVDARDVVARLGSDEFAVLVRSLGDILHVESIARRILNNLSKAVTLGSRSIYLGASVGIAIGSASYEHAEDVMRDAEIAMQHAKSSGGTRYALFDSKMHARAQKRLELITDLRVAIERSEFRLLYQPIVNIGDGRPTGCEALIRWDHPTEGVINPIEFIPLAEQTGLASAIGRYVLETAASQLASWRRNRGGTLDFTMHVNISASELSEPDFERMLVQVVEHHGLAPEDLTLEITESVVLDAGTRANATLERVRDRGFKICIDDFGTGYSSMRYLQQFKVDAIKIDRSFVAGPDGDLASEPIVRTLMTLAEAFDVRVVAEGVETARQSEILRQAGCRFAQGFLYARPLSASEMVSMYPEALGRAPRSASA